MSSHERHAKARALAMFRLQVSLQVLAKCALHGSLFCLSVLLFLFIWLCHLSRRAAPHQIRGWLCVVNVFHIWRAAPYQIRVYPVWSVLIGTWRVAPFKSVWALCGRCLCARGGRRLFKSVATMRGQCFWHVALFLCGHNVISACVHVAGGACSNPWFNPVWSMLLCTWRASPIYHSL